MEFKYCRIKFKVDPYSCDNPEHEFKIIENNQPSIIFTSSEMANFLSTLINMKKVKDSTDHVVNMNELVSYSNGLYYYLVTTKILDDIECYLIALDSVENKLLTKIRFSIEDDVSELAKCFITFAINNKIDNLSISV